MRSKLLAGLAVAVAACHGAERPPPGATPTIDTRPTPIEHVERCPGARATWRGERTDDDDLYATLTVDADGATKPIVIDLDDIPRASWSFAIFSPDCTRVLLLRSRSGPLDVVRVDHLARYAAGEPPEHALRGKPDPKSDTGVGNLRDGTWISNSEIDYAWGCCDPPIDERFVIPRP